MIAIVLTLLGSAATAAWISVWWQRSRYEAEVVHDSFKAVIAAHSALAVAIARCAGLLRAEALLGRIWESQREEMVAALQSARERLTRFDAAISVYHAVDTHSDTTNIIAALRTAARDAVNITNGIAAWGRVEPPEGARITILRDGLTHDVLAQRLEEGIATLNSRVEGFVGHVRERWRGLFRPRSSAVIVLALLTLLIGAGLGWKVCRWFHRSHHVAVTTTL